MADPAAVLSEEFIARVAGNIEARIASELAIRRTDRLYQEREEIRGMINLAVTQELILERCPLQILVFEVRASSRQAAIFKIDQAAIGNVSMFAVEGIRLLDPGKDS